VVLHGDHGALGAQHAVVAFDQDVIGKLQRMIDSKQHFIGRPEFYDRILKKDVAGFGESRFGIIIAFAIADGNGTLVTLAMGSAEFHGNPHWCRMRKELRQAADEV
jgi:hypothetical protein